MEELCSGRLEGGAVGSRRIALSPGRLLCGTHLADTKTAGSCMLLAQSALPCLLFAAPAARQAAGDGCDAAAAAGQAAVAAAAPLGPPDEAVALQAALQRGAASCLELRGGTDAAMAPPAGYIQHVLLPVLRSRLGVLADMRLERRGFFPKGQGRVVLRAAPLAPGTRLPPIGLSERGEIVAVSVRAFTAGRLAPSIGQRMAAAAQKGGAQRRRRADARQPGRVACCAAATPWGGDRRGVGAPRRAWGGRMHGRMLPGSCAWAPVLPSDQPLTPINAVHAVVQMHMARCGVPPQATFTADAVHEPPERAFGDGCGVLLTARSSMGCLFGATGALRGQRAGCKRRQRVPVPRPCCPPPRTLSCQKAAGLGKRGVPAETVGEQAAGELMDVLASGACTDEWLQDQLIIFMALAEVRGVCVWVGGHVAREHPLPTNCVH